MQSTQKFIVWKLVWAFILCAPEQRNGGHDWSLTNPLGIEFYSHATFSFVLIELHESCMVWCVEASN